MITNFKNYNLEFFMTGIFKDRLSLNDPASIQSKLPRHSKFLYIKIFRLKIMRKTVFDTLRKLLGK